MGKLFGVVLVIIALASAYPIATRMYVMPEDISTHGHAIDDQLSDTMKEAGFSFLGAQLVLAFFVFKFAQRKEGAKLTHLPGGAKLVVTVAFIIVGAEVFALGVLGQKAWANVYFTGRRPASSLSISAMRVSTGNSALSIRTRSTKGIRTFSGSIRPMISSRAMTSFPANWPYP